MPLHATRRQFCQTALAGAATLALPRVVTAKKSGGEKPITGIDGYRYEVDHHWAQLPDKYTWQTTHNVAVGSDGLVYVTHEGRFDQPDHPSIFVFEPDGKFVRAFGEQFQGGGHGIEVKNEGGEDFLYLCLFQQQRSIAKMTAAGELLWRQGAPMEAGGYHKGEGDGVWNQGKKPWGRDRFMPTNIAFHPTDGGFYVADGYGGWRVHYYNAEGEWVRSLGEAGDANKADGTFRLPHGVWIDDRQNKASDEPLLVVADRSNARLQWFTLEGEHRKTMDGFLLPASFDTRGDVLMVPDLVGRVTLLDKDNDVITHLGLNTEAVQQDQKEHNGFHLRGNESQWVDGRFIHPHDACYDAEGNIYVAEWVQRGRVTKMTLVG